MPKVQLSASFCLAAVCEPGKRKCDYWDTITSGFLLEVRSSGGRTYYLRYFDERGRQRQLKIGGFADITFDQARKAAKRLRSEVVLGGDPLGDKAVKKAVPTYAALAEQHLAHAKGYQRSWESVEGLLRVHLVPRWGKHRLDEIRPQDIAQWLAEKAAEGLAPASVEKIRVTFGRSFELARQWDMPGPASNPVRSVPRPKFDNKRERFLTREQAGRLLDAAGRSLNPQLKSILGLLLLTGARVSELLQAEWRHVDLDRRAWHIPITKTGKARYVPLSQAAVDVIESLPRFTGCQYLIPNPETRLPYVSIKHAWQTARREAGMRDLRIHDLRHSAASFMINGGVDLYAVGRILGHADHQSTQRYAHLANETLMRAVEAGAAGLAAQAHT
ncbi:site-specific integrase [Sphingomonas glaciei]|uniref:Site-specific integrase n=1 Tax=Sphingomonas glaciei TaxID=2938948 RepID=A0ABY5MSW6_9SPHN|nr:site-specific integrase [Sphingomonas glaciei]UUR07584.1 site-specific integrase [Sphingomonas glaciei]